jgi:hypothetical protein
MNDIMMMANIISWFQPLVDKEWRSMRTLIVLVESDYPPVRGEQLPPPPPAPAKSKRRLYAVLGLVCIAVVFSALVLGFLVPGSLGETIPYGFNYVVGEKMTYNMSVGSGAGVQSFSETGTLSIEILGFDGANYTMNETVAFGVQGLTERFSYTVKMDKSGRMVEISNLPSQMQELSSMFGVMPGFGFPSNKTEVRVGETWQLPLNLGSSGSSLSGTLNCKFGNVQNFTVPAGTYKAFRIDEVADNVRASVTGVSVSMDMNGQSYMEYGTCRLLQMNMQVNETLTETQTMTMSMNMQVQLTQHVKP